MEGRWHVKSLLLLLSILFSAQVFADGLIKLDFGYWMNDVQQGSDNKTSRQIIDLTAGYLWPMGFTIFGQYSMQTDSSTGQQDGKGTSYGPGIGFVSRGNDLGGYILGTYYFSAEYAQGSTTQKGTGYQIDLGLKIPVKSIFIVAGMSYEHFDYPKNNVGPNTPTLSHSQIDPRIGLMFEF